jgi:hypothetical protein
MHDECALCGHGSILLELSLLKNPPWGDFFKQYLIQENNSIRLDRQEKMGVGEMG